MSAPPDTGPEPGRLLARAEVAALFSVDGKTVNTWAKDGRLPSSRTPGGRRRYREGDVRALLAGAGRLLSPERAAAVFRVQPRALARWAGEGKLTPVRTPGGHRRYREEEVLALAEKRAAKKGAAS